ncbi:MAG: CsgG/HfaB family protein [Lacipirellulaceae bacterium]
MPLINLGLAILVGITLIGKVFVSEGSANTQTPNLTWAVLASRQAQETGIPDLLTVKLDKLQGVDLVERDEFEAVLSEAKLTALSGLESRSQRMKIGQRVAADILVILRVIKVEEVAEAASTGQPQSQQRATGRLATMQKSYVVQRQEIEVVLCHVRSGARLEIQGYSLATQAPAKIAQRIAHLASQINKELQSGLVHVVGVSPLLSKSLTHEHDAYQESLARLIESTLVSKPGIAVIEYQEAQAIWDELADQSESKLDRIVPILISGSFRAKDSTGEQEDLFTVELAAKLPANVTRSARFVEVAESQLFEQVSRHANRLLDENGKWGEQAHDAQQQFTWLEERAEAFSRLGMRRAACGLRQAALLIRPKNAEVRLRLIEDERRILRMVSVPGYDDSTWPGPAGSLGRAENLLSVHADILSHSEYLIRNRLVTDQQALSLITTSIPRFSKREVEESSSLQQLLSTAEQRLKQHVWVIAPLVLQLPQGPHANHENVTSSRKRQIQSALLGNATHRVDFQDLQPSDLEYLFELWTERIPDNLGFSPELRNISRKVFPDIDNHRYSDRHPKPRYRKRNYDSYSISPKQWLQFLEALSYSDHTMARLTARWEQLRCRWYLVDANTSPKEITFLLDMATLAVAEWTEFLHAQFEQPQMHDATVPLRDVRQMRWQLERFEIVDDPFGPRRKLEPKLRKQRPRRAPDPNRVVEPPPMSYERLSIRLHFENSALPRDVHPSLQGSYRFPRKKSRIAIKPRWIACGESLDVIWTWKGLLVMQTPGKLEPFDFPFERSVVIDDVRWDGKHLWVATLASGIWQFDSNMKVLTHIRDGLPPSERAIRVQPLGEGQALAVGSFGPNERAWCAMIVTQDKKAAVKVFHEATEVFSVSNTNPGTVPSKQVGIAHGFTPTIVMAELEPRSSAGEPRGLVYVGRSGSRAQPLLINLSDLTIQLGSRSLAYNQRNSREEEFVMYQGKVYHTHNFFQLAAAIGPPRKQPRSFRGHRPRGQAYLREGDYLHLPLSTHWWRLDLNSGAIVDLQTDKRGHSRRLSSMSMPEAEWYANSAHYGFVGVSDKYHGEIYRFTLHEPASVGSSDNRNIRATSAKAKLRVIDADELQRVKSNIKKLLASGHHVPPDATVLYQDGWSTFDGWLPSISTTGTYLDPPVEEGRGRMSYYVDGRLVRTAPAQSQSALKRTEMLIWYDKSSRPILVQNKSVDDRKQPNPRAYFFYYWGEYDARGLLSRVLSFDDNLRLRGFIDYEHGDNYQWVTISHYSAEGKLIGSGGPEYPLDSEGVPILPGEDRPIAYSARLEQIKEPMRLGMKPYYPLPGDGEN